MIASFSDQNPAVAARAWADQFEKAQRTAAIRHPLDPVTIVDSHALTVITVGAMMSEVSAEEYLIDLIDRQAPELHRELGREMIRPELSSEEYAALCRRHP